ncbi:MAG: hypothetical protein ABEL51_05320 [Salinibacter sp.]
MLVQCRSILYVMFREKIEVGGGLLLDLRVWDMHIHLPQMV